MSSEDAVAEKARKRKARRESNTSPGGTPLKGSAPTLAVASAEVVDGVNADGAPRLSHSAAPGSTDAPRAVPAKSGEGSLGVGVVSGGSRTPGTRRKSGHGGAGGKKEKKEKPAKKSSESFGEAMITALKLINDFQKRDISPAESTEIHQLAVSFAAIFSPG